MKTKTLLLLIACLALTGCYDNNSKLRQNLAFNKGYNLGLDLGLKINSGELTQEQAMGIFAKDQADFKQSIGLK